MQSDVTNPIMRYASCSTRCGRDNSMLLKSFMMLQVYEFKYSSYEFKYSNSITLHSIENN